MRQAEKDSRRIPEERAAAREEIVAAYEALTRLELLRLELFAKWRVRGLGRFALGRGWDDLLGQAVADTYEGRRRWDKDAVDFTGHLVGAMRSISSHWRERFNPQEPLLESDVVHISHEGKISNPILEAVEPGEGAQRDLEVQEEVERLEAVIQQNSLAWLVLEGRRDGMSGPQICEALEITQNQYEAAMKWLRRNIGPNVTRRGSNE